MHLEELMTDEELFGDTISDIFGDERKTETYNKAMLLLYKAMKDRDTEKVAEANKTLYNLMDSEVDNFLLEKEGREEPDSYREMTIRGWGNYNGERDWHTLLTL